jgi:mannose-6-phosphate isomerase-like protein (cupin superfamily)
MEPQLPRQATTQPRDAVVRKRLELDARPSWSDVTSAGTFEVEPEGRFDRHHHDCDEYWLIFAGRGLVLVGEEIHGVEQGDIVCIRTGVDHDVLGVLDTIRAFWFEGATPPGGRVGHLHRTREASAGHPVPRIGEAEWRAAAGGRLAGPS